MKIVKCSRCGKELPESHYEKWLWFEFERKVYFKYDVQRTNQSDATVKRWEGHFCLSCADKFIKWVGRDVKG